MALWSLHDKVVLITGGARGIGAAVARELAHRGAIPVLADLDAEALVATAASLRPAPPTIQLDVTDPRACQAAVEQTVGELGRLDVIWANAGIVSLGPVQLSSPAAWTRTVEVNLLGAYHTIRAALPAVIAQRGYVAVTASLASFAHAPHMSAYSATKAGVEAMCNSLRIEVAQYGVDVATIHPTWTDTDMVREGDASMASFKILRAALNPPFKRTYPVERIARDIANGFEQRRRRICTPRFVYALQALRPLMTTRLIERDLLAAAPEMDRAFQQEMAARGTKAASVSERVAPQLPETAEQVLR